MVGFVLPVALALQAAFAAQALSANQRSSHNEEAMRLAASIEASLKEALHPDYFESNFVPDDDFIAGLNDVPELRHRVPRDAEPEGAPDEDVEEVAEDEGCGEDGQPPATGLRRWVIRIRNVMFGRRDLEGTEGGEAEGEPEPGRTWMESLAHWFAHGIKRLLIRISGDSDDAAGAAGEGAEEHPEDEGREAVTVPPRPTSSPAPAPAPAPKRKPKPTSSTSTSTASSAGGESQPAATTAKPWTALPPVPEPSEASAPAPSVTTTEPRAGHPASAPAGTVYDDEVFGTATGQEVETNELS